MNLEPLTDALNARSCDDKTDTTDPSDSSRNGSLDAFSFRRSEAVNGFVGHADTKEAFFRESCTPP